MNTSTLTQPPDQLKATFSVTVNSTKLVALELNERETWITLTCAVCGEPIAPPENGNLVWNTPDDEGTPLAPFGDVSKVALLDAAVFAVHKHCDPEDRLGRCWTPLDAVLSCNQNMFSRFRQSREYVEFAEWKARREKWARAKLLRDFRELCRIEPRLADLYERAKAIRDDGKSESFCANAHWYGYHGHAGLKPVLVELVGSAAKRSGADPRLCTSAAYDTCYHAVYDALPPCRNCGCL